ncbi:class D sortase [Acidaminobacter sp. JC074]|uniref:class D sortase n=1 Tax=Acidaminobacter sp. JC074 TaxID=2530199 RepID=UPI001F0DD8B8|nr:class D sortase [Acidaminobacter sp. JC074]MCH4888814.1 class D sortase [Acidaminobacter sp. JC074]
MKRFIPVLMIIIGLMIIFTPGLVEKYHDYQVETIRVTFEEAMASIEVDDASEEVVDFDPTPAEKPVGEERVYTREERNDYIVSAWPVEAMLTIDTIDLEMPVILGATDEYLNVSVCALEGTGKPWTGGNYVIAGHRSLTYGRHFNRLNEVLVDDLISVTDLEGQVYTYLVYSVSIVHQTEVHVADDHGFKEITLITCDPIGQKNPEYRLVVQAKLK